MLWTLAQVVPVMDPMAGDWFTRILQGGSFALGVFIVLFACYYLLYEVPKIRKEGKEERDLERASRHEISGNFQKAIVETTKAHLDMNQLSQKSFQETLRWIEDRDDGKLDKILAAWDRHNAAWEKRMENICEFLGDKIESAYCRMHDHNSYNSKEGGK